MTKAISTTLHMTKGIYFLTDASKIKVSKKYGCQLRGSRPVCTLVLAQSKGDITDGGGCL